MAHLQDQRAQENLEQVCTAPQCLQGGSGIISVWNLIYVNEKSVCSALNMFVKYLGNPAQIYQHPVSFICAQSGYEQPYLKPADFAYFRFLFKNLTKNQNQSNKQADWTDEFCVQDIAVSAPGVYLPLRHDWNL